MRYIGRAPLGGLSPPARCDDAVFRIDGQDAKMGFMWALEAALALGDRAKAGEVIERIEAGSTPHKRRAQSM